MKLWDGVQKNLEFLKTGCTHIDRFMPPCLHHTGCLSRNLAENTNLITFYGDMFKKKATKNDCVCIFEWFLIGSIYSLVHVFSCLLLSLLPFSASTLTTSPSRCPRCGSGCRSPGRRKTAKAEKKVSTSRKENVDINMFKEERVLGIVDNSTTRYN